MPEKEGVLRLYQGDKPIFSYFDIESQIESIFKRRVPLKSGGYIVIDGTEALTAIDVNSGRSVRGANQEDTAFRTNLEAAVEIARQLRLRDLGGLIVIDFIDMRNPQHITEVEKALRSAMFEDKARHEIGRISHFGLLEVSRQRLRPAATATTYVSCPMCDGYGLVRTTESAALVALRKVHNRVAQGDVGSVRVALPPEVAMYLLNQKREDLAQLERRYNTKIVVVPKADLMPHQCEIEVKPRREPSAVEAVPAARLGGLAAEAVPSSEAVRPTNGSAPSPNEMVLVSTPVPETAAVAEATAAAPEVAPPEASKQAKRRRRRGRRRGKGRLAAAALQEALSALAARASQASTEGSPETWTERPQVTEKAAAEQPTAVPASKVPEGIGIAASVEPAVLTSGAEDGSGEAMGSVAKGARTKTEEGEREEREFGPGEVTSGTPIARDSAVAQGVGSDISAGGSAETGLSDFGDGQMAASARRRRSSAASTRSPRRSRQKAEKEEAEGGATKARKARTLGSTAAQSTTAATRKERKGSAKSTGAARKLRTASRRRGKQSADSKEEEPAQD
ncbi:Ribonuclease E [bacterium HR30]|nr:Ribonuclease E [bacterium HR30]